MQAKKAALPLEKAWLSQGKIWDLGSLTWCPPSMFRLLRVCLVCVLASSASVSREVWVRQYGLVLSLKFGLPLLGQLILPRHALEIRTLSSSILYTVYTSLYSYHILPYPDPPTCHTLQNLKHAAHCRHWFYKTLGLKDAIAPRSQMGLNSNLSGCSKFWRIQMLLDLLWGSSVPHVAEILLGVHCQAKTWWDGCDGVLAGLSVSPSASLNQTRLHNLQLGSIPSLSTHPAFASLTRFWSGVSKNSSSSQLNKISKRSKAVKGSQVKCLMLPAVLFCGLHRLSVQTLQDASTPKNIHTLWIFIIPCQQNSSINMILLQ